ncbi:MAG: DUF1385 domain-containing protein [Armatimonadota bacterium]|nr:DUF1385 domain-containing protein [Armatimonadota bacterium]
MQVERLTKQDDRIIDLVRQATPLYRESSLAAALDSLRSTGAEVVPVVDGSLLVGAVWADDARSAILSGEQLSIAVDRFVDKTPPILNSSTGREEARAILTASGRPAVIVVDPDGRYLGVLRVFDLYHLADRAVRPPMVGGMATPLGVYLTTGSLAAGARGWALVLTGMAMTAMLFVGVVITAIVETALPSGTPNWFVSAVVNLLPVTLFFLQVRLSPIAATHGAEHMVVHAIERGEPLRPDVVRRMPRVHPRCGTNLAIGALIFSGVVQVTWASFQEAGALIALVLTLSVWKPLGSFAQKYVTTREPREKDIRGAIYAAEELILRFQQSDRRVPSIGTRLLASGLPLILLGSFIVMALAPYVIRAIGLSDNVLRLLG